MHIILGGTGNVGSAVAKTLLGLGQDVTVVTRHRSHAEPLHEMGAEIAEIDVLDTHALRRLFSKGTRLFLLNPPADPSKDSAAEERKSLASILSAIDGAGLRKIVAESTYGARPGDRIGDLAVLYEMEQALAAQPVPATIIRAAYYMSNWQASFETAREDGYIQTLLPENFSLPMVSPEDIGEIAAGFMVQRVDRNGIHYVEGPVRYSPRDVADAFSKVLGKEVTVKTIPEWKWHASLEEMGYSSASAKSFANMTAATLDGGFPENGMERGSTTIDEYLKGLL